MGTRLYDLGVDVGMVALTQGHRLVDRVSGGRLGRRLGTAPAVWVTARGRRTGTERSTPLVAARDGDAWLVAGSAGGREAAPAWVFNLRGHAERGEPVGVRSGHDCHVADVEELTGAERDRGFAQMVAVYRGFAVYQRNTSRTIPVFRLTPRPGPPTPP